jgi:diaminopimelate epimerase
MKPIHFWKIHHNGNDFVMVDQNELLTNCSPLTPEQRTCLYSSIAQYVSPWHNGIGSDGLLVYSVETRNRIIMRMFCSDGSEDFCGNGLLCVAKRCFDLGLVDSEFEIEEFGQKVSVIVSENGKVIARFPVASFDPYEVPLDDKSQEVFCAPLEVLGETLMVSSLTTGGTHTVIMCEKLPDDDYFVRMSSAIEVHTNYPDRTNIMWVVPKDCRTLEMRIWERGNGETFACGSGSLATATVWSRINNLHGPLSILSKGGVTSIQITAWDKPIEVMAHPISVFKGCFEFSQ